MSFLSRLWPYVSASGNMGIGTTAPANKLDVLDVANAYVRVAGDANAAFVAQRGSSDAASPALIFRKSRGTAAAPAVAAQFDYGASLLSAVWDGSAWITIAGIETRVSNVPASNDVGALLDFRTRAGGVASPLSLRLRIDADGRFYTGGLTGPAAGYTAAGDITLPAAGGARAKNTAKAWVTFTPFGVIQDQWNVSTVTRNSIGDFTITFTNALANTDYLMVPMPGGQRGVIQRICTMYDTKTVNGIRVAFVDLTGALQDPHDTGLAFYGL